MFMSWDTVPPNVDLTAFGKHPWGLSFFLLAHFVRLAHTPLTPPHLQAFVFSLIIMISLPFVVSLLVTLYHCLYFVFDLFVPLGSLKGMLKGNLAA